MPILPKSSPSVAQYVPQPQAGKLLIDVIREAESAGLAEDHQHANAAKQGKRYPDGAPGAGVHVVEEGGYFIHSGAQMRPWAGVVKNRRRQTLSASTLADHLADGLQKIGRLDGFGQKSGRSPKLRATIGQCFVEQR